MVYLLERKNYCAIIQIVHMSILGISILRNPYFSGKSPNYLTLNSEFASVAKISVQRE